jgi:prepilin signal peptidase PulO-like enzyme (type II secretory pathway)
VLTAALFAAFAFKIGPEWTLLLRSLWIAILVQVIFFDLEHRLILDRVLVPAILVALGLSFVTPHLGWKLSLLAGLGAGLLFLLVAVVGAWVFRAEALGIGDVKLSVFIGLVVGLQYVLPALFWGVFLAGTISILLVAARRSSLKDSIAYGPYLAAGTLIVLFQMSR